jgi:branched-chain amino acid transport system ATP-binding protein
VSAVAETTASAEPILRLRGIGRHFGGVRAVEGVDLDIFHGERRVILGPNGAGKTTLFHVISGDLRPSAGTIEAFGDDITPLPARRRAGLGITRTYQTSRLFLGLSVEDNLYLAVLGVRKGHLRPLRLSGRDGAYRAQAQKLAEDSGLRERLATVVGSLSHGEQRQLEVAMARAGSPKLLLLDEPASGLSPGERVALTEMLLGLERHITLILIEHDMDVALRVGDRVTMMFDGRIIVEGTPAEIRANEQVHELYLGSHHREE